MTKSSSLHHVAILPASPNFDQCIADERAVYMSRLQNAESNASIIATSHSGTHLWTIELDATFVGAVGGQLAVLAGRFEAPFELVSLDRGNGHIVRRTGAPTFAQQGAYSAGVFGFLVRPDPVKLANRLVLQDEGGNVRGQTKLKQQAPRALLAVPGGFVVKAALVDAVFDLDGKLLWETKGKLWAAGDSLFLVEDSASGMKIASVEPRTGKPIWRFSWRVPSREGLATISANHDVLVAWGRFHGALVCLDLQSGKLRWEQKRIVDRDQKDPPLVTNDAVIFTSLGGKVAALSLSDGTPRGELTDEALAWPSFVVSAGEVGVLGYRRAFQLVRVPSAAPAASRERTDRADAPSDQGASRPKKTDAKTTPAKKAATKMSAKKVSSTSKPAAQRRP